MDRLRLAVERDAPTVLTAADEWATLARTADRRRALGHFLRHLALGEKVAHAAAIAQAAIADNPHPRRFFHAQARQEAMHRRVFDTAAIALGAPALRLAPDPYAQFSALIARAVARGLLLETVVATQVVLEALGEALLSRLEAGLARHRATFPDLRRRILGQEIAHHAFGMQWVAREVAAHRVDVASLQAVAAPYVAQGDAMIVAGANAIAHFALTPAQIGADFRARLPSWAQEAA
jgi:hypothetical protein